MVPTLIRRTLALSLAAAVAGACTSTPESEAAQTTSATAAAVNTSAQVSATRRTAITQAVASVAPSVVTVQTEMVQQAPADPFSFFFGGQPQARVSPGLGTGFVTRSDGIIVTNAHVVAGAQRVSVMMRDGKVYPARVLAQDETNDLAVIKISASNLPVVKLGNSDNLLVGEWAIAIGNPYGFLLGNPEPSVTVGVISAVGRNLVAPGEGQAAYFDMIQTDASINPGNSGGPLVDADGEVIGVNSSIYSPSGGSVGLGFAIPINRAMRVVDDLLSHGSVRRPWIGISLRHINTANPRDVIASGAIIQNVAAGSPAERAGLRSGDVILQAGTRTIHNEYDWQAVLLGTHVGDHVHLRVQREGRQFETDVQVVDLPEATAPKVQVLRDFELATVTPAIRASRNIRSPSGALITGISQHASDELGLQDGDVIVAVNNRRVSSAEDVKRLFDYFGGRNYMRIVFERNGQLYQTDPFTVQ